MGYFFFLSGFGAGQPRRSERLASRWIGGKPWQNCACVAQMSWFWIRCFDMLKRPLRWLYLWHESHERWWFISNLEPRIHVNMSMSSWSESFPSKPKGGFDGPQVATIFRPAVEFQTLQPALVIVQFSWVFCWGYFIRVPGTQLPRSMLGSWRIGRGVNMLTTPSDRSSTVICFWREALNSLMSWKKQLKREPFFVRGCFEDLMDLMKFVVNADGFWTLGPAFLKWC